MRVDWAGVAGVACVGGDGGEGSETAGIITYYVQWYI